MEATTPQKKRIIKIKINPKKSEIEKELTNIIRTEVHNKKDSVYFVLV